MQLFETPSGAGGKFTVKIIDQQHEGKRIGVQVHMPRNPDWHGHKFVTCRDRLKPVQEDSTLKQDLGAALKPEVL